MNNQITNNNRTINNTNEALVSKWSSFAKNNLKGEVSNEVYNSIPDNADPQRPAELSFEGFGYYAVAVTNDSEPSGTECRTIYREYFEELITGYWAEQKKADNTLIEDILFMNLNSDRSLLEDVTEAVDIYREYLRRTDAYTLYSDTMERGMVMDILSYLKGEPVFEFDRLIDNLVAEGLLPEAPATSAADAKPLFTEEDLIQEYADTAEKLGYDFVFFDLRELTLPEIYELHIENGYWSFEDAVEYATRDQHKLNYHKQYAA